MTGTFASRAALAAATALFLATASAVAHEPAKPDAAPATGHPGLQVLPKDIPHDRLIAVMKSYSQALGVRCTHCHVGTEGQPKSMNFASDEKWQKKTARSMMLMVKRINEDEFHVKDWSETKVSCFTCHRGATRPLTIAPAPPAPPPPPATPPAG